MPPSFRRLAAIAVVALAATLVLPVPGARPAAASDLDTWFVNDVEQVEGTSSGTTAFMFSIERQGLPLLPASVVFSTANGTATAGADYAAQNVTLSFNVLEASKVVTVEVAADSAPEANENFKVSIVPDGPCGRCEGTGTIRNDDGPVGGGSLVTLSVNDVTVIEGNSGSRPAAFTVTLSPAQAVPVSVDVTTFDAGATAAIDYSTTTLTLAFNPGEFSKVVPVPVIGDTTVEPDEAFFLALSRPVNAGLADIEGEGTIVDDDGAAPPSGQGYTLVGADGGIFTFGSSEFHGSTGDKKLNQPVIGMAHTPTGKGYWMVARDGGIFTFGDAEFFGSMGDKVLNAPVLGMEPTPTGRGYFLFAADGGIFTFGDAVFIGSTGDKRLNAPVVGMAETPTGRGYWLVAEDGGIFNFGDAEFFGSTGDRKLNQPVFDMASTKLGTGYWLVAKDGGVFTFGGAEFFGAPVGQVSGSAVGIGATPTSKGYWIADSRGAVFPNGDAQALGDRRIAANNATTVGFAVVPSRL